MLQPRNQLRQRETRPKVGRRAGSKREFAAIFRDARALYAAVGIISSWTFDGFERCLALLAQPVR